MSADTPNPHSILVPKEWYASNDGQLYPIKERGYANLEDDFVALVLHDDGTVTWEPTS